MNLDLLVQRSVALLQANAPADGSPYILRYSGGKDSDAILALAKIAGVPYIAEHSLTTLDAPEVVHHVQEQEGIRILRRKESLLHRMVARDFPSAKVRWCCREFKERTSKAGTLILGVRVAESRRRADRWTQCVVARDLRGEKKSAAAQKLVLAVRLWSDANIWEFLRSRNVKTCSIYDEGFFRAGCVGCPLVGRKQREREFTRWPKYRLAWRSGFDRLWAAKAGTEIVKGKSKGLEWFGSRVHDSVNELWEWWMDRCPPVTEWRIERGLRVKEQPKPGRQRTLFAASDVQGARRGQP